MMARRICIRAFAVGILCVGGMLNISAAAEEISLPSGDLFAQKKSRRPPNIDCSRPRPYEIVPNPTTSDGTRPYIRDVRGYREVQHDAHNYGPNPNGDDDSGRSDRSASETASHSPRSPDPRASPPPSTTPRSENFAGTPKDIVGGEDGRAASLRDGSPAARTPPPSGAQQQNT